MTDYQKYVGSTDDGAANDELSPISIGWVNNQGGTGLSVPYNTSGAEAAVSYINEQLGGIDGHPVKLSTCFIPTSEEDGTKCGLQMANDDSVKIVANGITAIGGAALSAAMNGQKPMIQANSSTVSDTEAKNFYIYASSPLSALGIGAVYAKSINAKEVSVLAPNAGSGPQIAALLKGQVGATGAKATTVTFDAASSNLTSALVAAKVTSADLVLLFATTTPQCTALASGLRSLNVSESKTFAFGSTCFTTEVSEALNGDGPKWLLGSSQSIPTFTSEPDVKVYREALDSVGVPEATAEQFDTVTGFSMVMTAARFINEAGGASATSAEIAAKAKAFKGPTLMGNPTADCGGIKGQPALCGWKMRVFQALGGDDYKIVERWVSGLG